MDSTTSAGVHRGGATPASPHAHAAIVILLLSATLAPLLASDESQACVREGLERLRTGEFAPALERFQAASKADPADVDALLYRGVALNRLGRFEEALTKLLAASATPRPELDFEAGWSLMRLGRPDEAIARLESFERSQPGRGQTSEFLGRCWLAKGDLDKAERLLQEALQRDPRLKSTVRTYLVALKQKRGEPSGVEDELARLAKAAAGTPLGTLAERHLREHAPQVPGVEADRRWLLGISAGGGWNSNAIPIDDSRPVPLNFPHRDSAFGRPTLNGAYLPLRDDVQTLTLGYVFQGDVYENGFEEVDYLDHYGHVQYDRKLVDRIWASLRVADEYSMLEARRFRNQVSARPALYWYPTEWLTVETAYIFSENDYLTPFSAVSDRDGLSHTALVATYVRVSGTELRGRVGYYHTWNEADGEDYDAHFDSAYVGLSHPIASEVSADAYYSRTWGRYDERNSFSGFLDRRRDDIDVASFQLWRPIPMPGSLRGRAYPAIGSWIGDHRRCPVPPPATALNDGRAVGVRRRTLPLRGGLVRGVRRRGVLGLRLARPAGLVRVPAVVNGRLLVHVRDMRDHLRNECERVEVAEVGPMTGVELLRLVDDLIPVALGQDPTDRDWGDRPQRPVGLLEALLVRALELPVVLVEDLPQR